MTMPKRRTANFREDETRLLIQLWGSPTIQNQMITSHRKAPIMLQLAALMQQYGFYRTPEEITTRIRNLKCIYHRIKKSLRTGIGLVDPDWHHFKAIDAILGNGSSHYGPGSDFTRRVIKTENTMDDVTNSIYSNDSQSSFYDDDREITGSYTSSPPMQGLTITSSTAAMADLSSSLRLNQAAAAASRTRYNFGSEISIRPIVEIKKEPGQPFPLSASRVGAANHSGSSDDFNFKSPEPKRRCMSTQNDNEVSGLLRQLLDVEREHLELEKQRLEFDRMVGTQLLALVPMVGSIIQNHYLSQQQQQQKHQNSPSQSNFQAESPSQMEPTTAADDDEDQDEDDEDEEENEVNTQDVAEDVGNSILKSFAEFQSIQLKNKANEIFPVTSSLPSKGVNSDREEQSSKSNKSPARESLSSDDLSEDTEASCDGSEVNALSGTAEKTECLEKLKDADIENGERNFPEIIESEDDITFLENC
uniref:Myb/SANT-like DNA-binding domain-containing protein n=1 Tax=Timema poppense TaxID=170557 RepID=A0A7R9H214_TIMPO|nr:unnamed protein product [Timema poppensis]